MDLQSDFAPRGPESTQDPGKVPFFSVVIPTRNRVALLERALQRVAAQTFADYEVIVVDDGSTDGTPAFLQALQMPKVRFVRNDPNLGVSGARNRGVAVARGALVVFLDDDDETRPCALQALRERLAATPDLQFLWGGRLVRQLDREGRIIGLREDDWSSLPPTLSGATFLPRTLEIATNSVFAVRRALMLDLGGFDTGLRVSEDRDLFISLAERGAKGAAVARTLIDVNEHPSSLSRGQGARGGAQVDLRVIEKHRDYLNRPEHSRFLNKYFVTVFIGMLEQGEWAEAMRMLARLRDRRALRPGLLRLYVRHAPEFRAVKHFIRYDAIRGFLFRHLHRSRPLQEPKPQSGATPNA